MDSFVPNAQLFVYNMHLFGKRNVTRPVERIQCLQKDGVDFTNLTKKMLHQPCTLQAAGRH
jgi:hypothetical protein